jgi:hypothetical protein
LQEVVEALLVSLPERLKQNENKKTIVESAQHDLSQWIAWPQRALLLWEGCVRKGKKLPAEWVMPAEWVNEWITHSGRNAWHYVYPPEVVSFLYRSRKTLASL